ATLRLFVTDPSPDGGSVRVVSDDWVEGLITFNNAPPIAGPILASAGPVTAGQWVELDVSAAALSGPRLSFGLTSAVTNSALYSSREGVNAPELVVETLGPPQPPAADFSASPLAGGAPLTVDFTDLSTGAPTAWLWDFGDGGSSTERDPSHTYPDPGSYDVTLEVSNDQGSDSTTSLERVEVGEPALVLQFEPSEDARVRSSRPADNYGATGELRAKTSSTTYASYLKFDVAGLGDSPVSSAVLRLFVTNESRSGGSVHRVDDGWTEAGVTFANAPAIDTPALDSLGAVSLGTAVEFDVTAAITGDGTVSFGLRSDISDSVLYSSREGVSPPVLVIERAP
ncbi:MAG: DNRLRE domain-containing protein, partial [Myxococcales bacterium]|nr:DNRLRE domain-containing protein [Myxococcales bacterium]